MSHSELLSQLDAEMPKLRAKVDAFLQQHFSAQSADPFVVGEQKVLSPAPGFNSLLEATRYSVLQPGGKRFRPVLSLMTAQALGQPHEQVLPFGAAVECIHTYSLIHDDLPCMDNDDMRRGMPTNHKVYGESTALLAGDSLLTEAFALIAHYKATEPKAALESVLLLSQAAGLYGMVGGQVIDMGAKHEDLKLDDLILMQRLKTGALIRVAVEGAAVLAHATTEQRAQLKKYAEHVGLAFQVADDLLDHNPRKPEAGSYATLLGPAQAKEFLAELTALALDELKAWPKGADLLRGIAVYNQTRSV